MISSNIGKYFTALANQSVIFHQASRVVYITPDWNLIVLWFTGTIWRSWHMRKGKLSWLNDCRHSTLQLMMRMMNRSIISAFMLQYAKFSLAHNLKFFFFFFMFWLIFFISLSVLLTVTFWVTRFWMSWRMMHLLIWFCTHLAPCGSGLWILYDWLLEYYLLSHL